MKKVKNIKSSNQAVLIGIAAAFFSIDILFLFLISSVVKNIASLKNEENNLKLEMTIKKNAGQVVDKYLDSYELLQKYLPTKDTLPNVIESFESEFVEHSDSHKLTFSPPTPIAEGERLILSLNIQMKTDLIRLKEFFSSMENFPYMTHINQYSIKFSGATTEDIDVAIGMKIYVNKPFAGN